MHGLLASFSIYAAIDALFAWQQWLGHQSWQWIEHHGYIALFCLLFFSGLGLPLPEDVPLVAAGVQIARGSMTLFIAGPVAWVAMIMGDSALYLLGYLLGYRVVHFPLIGRHLRRDRLNKCEVWFERWGVWAIGIGRLFAGVRSAIVVAAGTMRFNYAKLLAADSMAAIVSGGGFMFLGFWAGRHSGPVRDIIERYKPYFTLGALILAILLIPLLWLRNRRRAAARRTDESTLAALAASAEQSTHL